MVPNRRRQTSHFPSFSGAGIIVRARERVVAVIAMRGCERGVVAMLNAEAEPNRHSKSIIERLERSSPASADGILVGRLERSAPRAVAVVMLRDYLMNGLKRSVTRAARETFDEGVQEDVRPLRHSR